MSAKQEEELPTLEQLLNANPRKRVRPKTKPTLVTDEGNIVGSASVHLSPSDPNWRGSGSQYVRVLDQLDEGGPRVISSYDPGGLAIMAEILPGKTEPLLLAQLDEIEDWSDYAAVALDVAKQQSSNISLQDRIAELAEEKFENGSKLTFDIYARAAREAEADAAKKISAPTQSALAKPKPAQPSAIAALRKRIEAAFRADAARIAERAKVIELEAEPEQTKTATAAPEPQSAAELLEPISKLLAAVDPI
jgi:hypothetical protein